MGSTCISFRKLCLILGVQIAAVQVFGLKGEAGLYPAELEYEARFEKYRNPSMSLNNPLLREKRMANNYSIRWKRADEEKQPESVNVQESNSTPNLTVTSPPQVQSVESITSSPPRSNQEQQEKTLNPGINSTVTPHLRFISHGLNSSTFKQRGRFFNGIFGGILGGGGPGPMRRPAMTRPCFFIRCAEFKVVERVGQPGFVESVFAIVFGGGQQVAVMPGQPCYCQPASCPCLIDTWQPLDTYYGLTPGQVNEPQKLVSSCDVAAPCEAKPDCDGACIASLAAGTNQYDTCICYTKGACVCFENPAYTNSRQYPSSQGMVPAQGVAPGQGQRPAIPPGNWPQSQQSQYAASQGKQVIHEQHYYNQQRQPVLGPRSQTPGKPETPGAKPNLQPPSQQPPQKPTQHAPPIQPPQPPPIAPPPQNKG